MYLSLTQLNEAHADDAHEIHRDVMGMFHPGHRRDELGVLWRVEKNGNILVRSNVAPVAGGLCRPEETLSVEPGDGIFFEVTVNPVRRFGKQTRLLADEFIPGWIVEETRLGGSLSDVDIMALKTTRYAGKPGVGARPSVVATRIQGMGTVKDISTLTHQVEHGLGRAKAYGCGLMTIVPV